MVNRLPKPAILIVEDESLIRIMAVDVLSDSGLLIYEAACASEALTIISDHPEITLLFTDINMPGDMNGLALAASVHAFKPDMNLIVTSGGQWLTDKDVPDSGTFLPKPYRATDLIALVAAKLGARAGQYDAP